jgi:hypothetical protein
MSICPKALLSCLTLLICHTSSAPAQAAPQSTPRQPETRQAWMDPSLDPDTRADLMIHQMTLDE